MRDIVLKWYFDWGSRERDWGRTGERDTGSAEDGMAGRARRALGDRCAQWEMTARWAVVGCELLLLGGLGVVS